jgi:ribosome recycling factor
MKTEQHAAPSGPAFTSVKEVEASIKTRMEKALSDLQHEMATIRTGRASLSILDNLRVDYYGTPTPLNQIANLHVPEPALITIQPWDVSQIGLIEKVIRTSDLGLNPANDGKIIRLPIPPLTEERRKELVKKLHGVAEHHRVAVRNIRRDCNDAVKKLFKGQSPRMTTSAPTTIQKLTDNYMGDDWSRQRKRTSWRLNSPPGLIYTPRPLGNRGVCV